MTPKEPRVSLTSPTLVFALLFAISWGGCGGKTPNQPRAESPGTRAPGRASEPVKFMWDPSSSAVVGYHVHRSEKKGGPYTRLTSSPVKETSYTDVTVVSGRTYYYVVTSIDAYGVESKFSNEIMIQVP